MTSIPTTLFKLFLELGFFAKLYKIANFTETLDRTPNIISIWNRSHVKKRLTT